jgi:hypothetical protein
MSHERGIPPELAYPRWRRVRHVFWFAKEASRRGSTYFERSKSREVARTYGLFLDGKPDERLVKRIKAKFRNELSFTEGK